MKHLTRLFKLSPLLIALATLTACVATTPVPSEQTPVHSYQPVPTIVSFSSSITETLVELGLSERIIGIDIHTPRLSEEVAVFDSFNPDIETLLALEPDVIFLAFPNPTIEAIATLQNRIHTMPPAESVTQISKQIVEIAEIVGMPTVAEQMVRRMNYRIDTILSAVAQLDTPAPSVYFEVGAEPMIFSLGSGTFLDSIIDMLGGVNIFADVEGWIPVSEEMVIDRNPQVIFTNVAYIPDPVGAIVNRPGWDSIDAVATGQVFLIDPIASSHSNQTIVYAIEAMARGMFGDIDLD